MIFITKWLTFFLVIITKYVLGDMIDDFMRKVDADVMKLKSEMEDNYSRRCDITDLNIYRCAYFSCSYTKPSLSCCGNRYTTECNCYDNPGFMCSMSKSSIRLANLNMPFTDPSDINVKEIVGSSSYLDDRFEILGKNTNYKWMYFGSNNGVMRTFPYTKNCKKYDNRLRPWYIAASSGTKNLILILDTSGSMTGQKLETLKQAINVLVDTLISSDRIGIITFNSKVNVYKNELTRATIATKTEIKEYISNLTASDGTNYSAAFEKANYLISNTFQDFDHPCKTILLFVTDGQATEGITNENELIHFIDNLPELKNVTIFSYAIGSLFNTNVPEKISCLRNGIFEYIQDYTSFSIRLSSYFIAISNNLEIEKPIWTEPYEDFTSKENITTCAIPVFDKSGSKPLLIGVIGIDVAITSLVSYGSLEYIQQKILQNNVFECSKITYFSKCEVNSLRDTYFKCKNDVSADGTLQNLFNNIPSSKTVLSDSTIQDKNCYIPKDLKPCPKGFNFQVFCDQSSRQTTTTDTICCRGASCPVSNISRLLKLTVYFSLYLLILLY